MPTTLPVANPDAYTLYNAETLYRSSWDGVLANDTFGASGHLSVTEVNGQSANVGTPLVLASGATLLLYGDGSFTFTPGTTAATDSFSYTLSDGSNTATTTVPLTGIEITVDPVADQQFFEGDTVSLQVSASESSGPALNYTFYADPLPFGLVMDSATGIISGTIAYGATGTFTSSIYAMPPDSMVIAYGNINWTVAPLEITVAAIADQEFTEGDAVSLQLSASISHGQEPGYTWHAWDLPTGLTLDSYTGVVSGTLESGSAGTWTTGIYAMPQNGSMAMGNGSITWNIAPMPEVITIAPIADQQNVEGDSISIQVNATINTPTMLWYSAEYLPNGLSIDSYTGEITGTITPDTAQLPSSVIVWAHGATASEYVEFEWGISPRITLSAIADQQNLQGDVIALQVNATSLDTNPLTYTATGLPDGLTLDGVTGAISGTLSPTALSSTVLITVSDGFYSTLAQFAWGVTSPVSIAGLPNQSNFEGDTVSSVSVIGSNANTGTLSYSATGLPSGLVIDTVTGVISGTIDYWTSSDTAALVNVTATDGVYSGTTWFFWTISPRVGIPPLGDKVSTVGDVIDFQIPVISAPGSTLSYTVSGLPSGLLLNANGLISGTIDSVPIPEDGPYMAEVTLEVGDGTTGSSRTFLWTVNARRTNSHVSAGDDYYTIPYGGRLLGTGEDTTLPTLLQNDQSIGSGGPLMVTAVSGNEAAVDTLITLASGSQVVIDVLGRVSYQAAVGFVGTEWVEYTVGNLQGSIQAMVFFQVNTQQVGRNLVEMLRDGLKAWAPDSRTLGRADLDKETLNFTALNQSPEPAAALAILRTFVMQAGSDVTKMGSYADLFGLLPNQINLTEENLKIFAKNLALPEIANPQTEAQKKQNSDGNRARTLNAIFLNQVARAQTFKIGEQPVLNQPAVPAANLLSIWGTPAQTVAGEKARLSDAVRQGYIGDCAFMSSLISFVRSEEPANLKGRISEIAPENGVRRFSVSLYNPQGVLEAVTVREPTFAQRLMYGNATDGTLWVSLFERAYLQMRDRTAPGNNFLAANQVLFEDSFYNTPMNGEALEVAMKYLTNKSEVRVIKPLSLATIQSFFDSYATKPYTFTACTPPITGPDMEKNLKGLGLFPNHAYAVIGYNAVTGIIHLRNPHNNPNPGPAQGKDIYLGISDFHKVFSSLAVQKLPN